MSKKCISCGAVLDDNALFCDDCGVKQEQKIQNGQLVQNEEQICHVPVVQQEQSVQPMPQSVANNIMPKRVPWYLNWATITVVFVINFILIMSQIVWLTPIPFALFVWRLIENRRNREWTKGCIRKLIVFFVFGFWFVCNVAAVLVYWSEGDIREIRKHIESNELDEAYAKLKEKYPVIGTDLTAADLYFSYYCEKEEYDNAGQAYIELMNSSQNYKNAQSYYNKVLSCEGEVSPEVIVAYEEAIEKGKVQIAELTQAVELTKSSEVAKEKENVLVEGEVDKLEGTREEPGKQDEKIDIKNIDKEIVQLIKDIKAESEDVLERAYQIGQILDENTSEKYGKCGENVQWFYKDGILVLRGTGAVWDFDLYSNNYSPWSELYPNIKWVIVENGVTSIGKYAFVYGDGIVRISLSQSVEKIEGGDLFGTFSECKKLSKIDFSEGIEYIGAFAFANCESIKEVSLPSTMYELGPYAFYMCDNLTNISLGSGIEVVEGSSLGDSLDELVVPASVKSILDFGNARKVVFEGNAPAMRIVDSGIYDGEQYAAHIMGLADTKAEQMLTKIEYHGKGFDEYINKCQNYTWVYVTGVTQDK